jgi:hypothetical protein
MSFAFSKERSTTSDSVGLPTDNNDLTMTTAVPLVSISLLQEGIPCDEFMFIISDKTFPTSVVEAVSLLPAVWEQLQIDACARRFVICDPDIHSTDFSTLHSLLSGVETVFHKSHQKSLILLSRQVGNVGLQRFFFSLWSNSNMRLSNAFATHSRVYLQSISDVLLLSVDALDDLLSTESFLVDSEEVLMRILILLRHPPLLRHIRWEFVSTALITSFDEDSTESLWLTVADRLIAPPPSPGLDSLIVSEFPPLFEEFRMKRFNLLWRGSRDGFTAKKFHRRCDGRANTLTLILDTDGNIFGGFTPVEWESPRSWNYKRDTSLQSFFFTLRNPHGVLPRKFALKDEEEYCTIRCNSTRCAVFGHYDICVCDHCSANRKNITHFGTDWNYSTYANDTACKNFFTGGERFTVKEIEVFEIAA